MMMGSLRREGDGRPPRKIRRKTKRLGHRVRRWIILVLIRSAASVEVKLEGFENDTGCCAERVLEGIEGNCGISHGDASMLMRMKEKAITAITEALPPLFIL